ncbi:DUF6042 family protein [Streptomyces clavuligerus]|uniref:DUF6042 family protein n=1 Tax=Streptomyces clavuligerus TaxID=1901 RepID=UPI0039C6257E
MPSDTTTAPSPAEDYLSLHNDWFPSLWTHVLPQHHSMMISMLFGTATVRRLEGDLDDIVEQVFGEDAAHALVLGDEGLDSPVLWVDEKTSPTHPEEAAEIHAAADAARSCSRPRCGSVPFPYRPRCGSWRPLWKGSGWCARWADAGSPPTGSPARERAHPPGRTPPAAAQDPLDPHSPAAEQASSPTSPAP